MTNAGDNTLHTDKINNALKHNIYIIRTIIHNMHSQFSPNLLAARNAKIPALNLKVSNETASPTKIWRME